MKKHNLTIAFFILMLCISIQPASSGDVKEDRGLERFYLSLGAGMLLPHRDNHANDNIYNYLETGTTWQVRAGWRYIRTERGAIGIYAAYNRSHAENSPPGNGYSYSPLYGNFDLNTSFDEVSITRYDFSIIDVLLTMGDKKESYFHVALNYILNKNDYNMILPSVTYQGLMYEYRYSEEQEGGFGAEMGFHIGLSNHFGIMLDGGFVIPGYKKTSSTFAMPGGGMYVTNSAESSGMHFYALMGLQFGIW